ncbi:MAG: hypothetical protein MK101_09385 [Phycisphaerales bacterium]|nr:hypothetical protein [Phycisphaerales bacterium]
MLPGHLLTTASPMTEAWWQVFGRLHPLILHFPIALVLLGAVVALVRWCLKKGDQPSPTTQFCLWGGLFFTALAVWTGWVFADGETLKGGALKYTSESYPQMDWHRWLSVSALGALVLAAIFDLMRRTPRWHWALPARLLALLLAAGLIAVSGHLGASMKWGDDFLLNPIYRAQEAIQAKADAASSSATTDASSPQQPSPQDGGSAEPADETGDGSAGDTSTEATEQAKGTEATPQTSVDGSTSGDGQSGQTGADASEVEASSEPGSTDVSEAITPAIAHAGWDTVEGLLDAMCVRCHGPDKQKGGLQILPWSALFADDAQFWSVAPGEPKSSLLLERITDEDDPMPPEGEGNMLNEAQVERIRAWIAAGATGPNGAEPPTIEVEPPNAGSGEPQGGSSPSPDSGARSDPSKVLPGPFDQAAEDAQLARLRERGVRAGALYKGSPWLQVDMSRLTPPADDATCAGLSALAGNLWSCSLAGTAITDAAMTPVATCTQLRSLRLDQTAVSDAGVKALLPLQRLEVLNCWNTKLTDACVDDIAALEGLRAVYLGNTGMSEAGLNALRAKRPALAVHGSATKPEASEETAADAPA